MVASEAFELSRGCWPPRGLQMNAVAKPCGGMIILRDSGQGRSPLLSYGPEKVGFSLL
jgi:hypothetical protein